MCCYFRGNKQNNGNNDYYHNFQDNNNKLFQLSNANTCKYYLVSNASPEIYVKYSKTLKKPCFN